MAKVFEHVPYQIIQFKSVECKFEIFINPRSHSKEKFLLSHSKDVSEGLLLIIYEALENLKNGNKWPALVIDKVTMEELRHIRIKFGAFTLFHCFRMSGDGGKAVYSLGYY